MTWNYRIVCDDKAIVRGDFQVREVYYEDGEPVGHGRPFLIGDSADDLRSTHEKMAKAFESPVLSEADFPLGHSAMEDYRDAHLTQEEAATTIKLLR